MQSLKEIVDVNTVVGDAVETKDGTVIIPISRVSFGFAAGGGDYAPDPNAPPREKKEAGGNSGSSPFAGGSGAGISVQPVGFLVVGRGDVRFLAVSERDLYGRLMDAFPQIIERLKSLRARDDAHKNEGRDEKV